MLRPITVGGATNSTRERRAALAQASTIDEVERLLLEACPAALPLVEQGGHDIAALGAIEDDELLDLPISIYSAG